MRGELRSRKRERKLSARKSRHCRPPRISREREERERGVTRRGRGRGGEGERVRADRVARRSALPPASVIGRTLIASEPAVITRQKVSERRKDPLASRYSGRDCRPCSRRIFSYYLEAAIHLPLLRSPRFSLTPTSGFVCPASPVPSAGRVSDFASAIADQAIAGHEIANRRPRRPSRRPIDVRR